jgi:alkylation response protein AidB-like acyl-CoA dehydrogenase
LYLALPEKPMLRRACHSAARRAPAGQQRRAIAASYGSPMDFEPINMKYCNDGVDSEYKQEVRKALSKNPLYQPSTYANWSPEKEHLDNVERLRAFMATGLLSVAHVRSTPRKFLSCYELLATVSGPLAMNCAAQYSMFANLAALHGQQYHHDAVLAAADKGEVIGCCAAAELFGDDVPYATTAQFDLKTGSYRLSTPEGSGGLKFALVNGQSAKWAIVTADLITAATNHGPQMFLVQLRDDKRKPMPGVSFKAHGRTSAVDACGLVAVRFADVALPREAMLQSTSTVSERGDVTPVEGMDPNASAIQPVVTSQRLANSAIALGKCKRMLHDIVNYACSKNVVGPMGERDHPLFGLQFVQGDVATLITTLWVLNFAWQRVSEVFCAVGEEPAGEHYVQLALVSSRLTEFMAELGRFGMEMCGPQGVLALNGFTEGVAMAALLREGPHASHMPRLIAREVAVNQYGSGAFGAYMKANMSGGALKRLFSNPFFSPTTQDMGRYLMLFKDREFTVRTKAAHELGSGQRAGAEEAFYVWNGEQHRLVGQLANAYGDEFLLRAIFDETADNRDPQNRRMLRDMSWQWALSRMQQDVVWLVTEGMLAQRHVPHLHQQLDNLSSVIAHQALNLSECLMIPKPLVTAPVGKDWEAHWDVKRSE